MQINRNLYFAELLIEAFALHGIKNFVLSPGSRNTPLTLAVSHNKKVKSYSIVDERSAGFFATGLVRSVQSPVVLICTSGTAAAEYLPSIIEAYFQGIPLIVCTADRPAALRDTGANQTIHQAGMYGSHVLESWDVDSPKLTTNYIHSFFVMLQKFNGYMQSVTKGPLHFNLQYEKPFEPDSITDNLSEKLLREIENKKSKVVNTRLTHNNFLDKRQAELVQLLKPTKTRIIYCGINAVRSKVEAEAILRLSRFLKAPIIAEGFSGLRSERYSSECIVNLDLFDDRLNNGEPLDQIIQFGKQTVSKAGEKLLTAKTTFRIIISDDLRLKGPAAQNYVIYNTRTKEFCDFVLKYESIKNELNNQFYVHARALEINARKAKDKIFIQNVFSEPHIIRTVTEHCIKGEALLIGNSMPPRDFDYSVHSYNTKLKLFHNRGASGIDGLIASAAGIAANHKKDVYLIIGDVSFFYDISSLYLLSYFKLPVTIILLNNGGGKIFDMLPISQYPLLLEKYYHLPVQLDFEPLVKGFKVLYKSVKSLKVLKSLLNHEQTFPRVIECKTSIENSKKFRSDVKSVFENSL